MPIRGFKFTKGGIYHVYNRGAHRFPIIKERRNYLYICRLLRKVSRESSVSVLAFCLLSNHYHWLLRQDGEISAGKVPRRVFGSYSQAYNKAYKHSGTLFQGPYKAIEVDSEAYLARLCIYIHLNPVKHGLVRHPKDWPYSDYHEWMRPANRKKQAFIEETFGSAGRYARILETELQKLRVST